MKARGSGWVLVDRSGVAFDTVDKRPRGLPKISAPVDEGPAALRATLDVLEALTPAVRDQVREVRAAGLEQVTLQLRRGRTRAVGERRALRPQGRRAGRPAVPQGQGLRRDRTRQPHHPPLTQGR